MILRARQLRQNPTEAEEILWNRLKGKKLGKRVRRQHPVGKYIFDFYCHHAKLVIEVDGKYHEGEEQQKLDRERERYIEAWGLKVLRFRNDEIHSDLEKVIGKIKCCIDESLE